MLQHILQKCYGIHKAAFFKRKHSDKCPRLIEKE